jgi:PAS domain S-box-containing protein
MNRKGLKILIQSKSKNIITFLKSEKYNVVTIKYFKDILPQINSDESFIFISDIKNLNKNNFNKIKNKAFGCPIIAIINELTDFNNPAYLEKEISGFFYDIINNYKSLPFLINKCVKQFINTKELFFSESNYRKIFNNFTEGIAIVQDGVIKYINSFALKFVKYSKNDLLNKSFLKFIYEEDRDKSEGIYHKRILGKENAIIHQIRFINKNKKIIWLNVSGVKIIWEGNDAILYFLTDITAMKTLEKELRYNEENLTALLNATKDLAFLGDKEGNILAINKIAKERIGRGKNVFKISPKYLKAIRNDAKTNILKNKQSINYIEEHKTSAYEINIYPVFDKNNDVDRIAVYASDITAYKKAERELKNNEEKFRSLIENSLDCIIIINQLGKIKFASPTVKNILGYDIEEVIGKTVFNFIHPTDYKKLFNAFLRSLKDPSYKELFEFQAINKNGKWQIVEGLGVNLLKNEIINGIVITFRDISERKKAQTELNMYKYIISSSNDQIIFINSNYTVLAVNDALLRAFNLKKESVVGFSIDKIFGEKNFNEYLRLKNYCEQCFGGLEVNFEKWFNYTKLGKRYISFSLYPYLEDEHIVGIVLNIRDLTERIEMESDIIDMREKEQQKIGIELHDGLSHELLGIAIKSRILSDKLAGKSVSEEKDAKEIEALINKTIDDTRLLARGLFYSDLEETDIHVLLKNIKNDIEAKYNINCTFEIDEKIVIDDIKIITQFYYIIQEAVKNSVKHSSAKNIIIKIFFEDTFLCLFIKDDGEGIVFENVKSNGMGLNIMRYRARMIGGTIDIQRGGDFGTEVKCVIKTTANN